MHFRVCWTKNAGVAGYAEYFCPVQSGKQASECGGYLVVTVLKRVWKYIPAIGTFHFAGKSRTERRI